MIQTPDGSMRKVEILNILIALALARPDHARALALVAEATGLGDHFRLPTRWRQRLGSGEVNDES